MEVVAALASDVGRWRQINEDSGYVGESMWVVADGMGGHAAGDVASTMALEVVQTLDQRGGISIADLHEVVAEASRAIRAYGSQHPDAAGLGTTIAGLAAIDVDGPRWAVFNVGDSRVYRLLGGRLERATVDHTEVEQFVQAGVISADEARRHPGRNVITQSLGSEPPPRTDVWVLPVTAGERFLVCSDGLTGELSDDAIREVLTAADDPQEAVDTLVRLAVEAGGHDNVTALVVDPTRAEEDDDDSEPTIIRRGPWTS
ncbi:MAG TPA: protein phosphatase 2C domain-containing protein [Propionibacteriaceae bacterium]|nr:protein phosphatase 2C domain-containing protein [Propionibacteriaceae bacterium]HPZ50578.1 protein phosphatase 2C domain-containing protein [Propionibacteriaceae bacterium]HQE32077.1 protein phosphatase 2C domain-containing protein [Propionibacteriaceae bacterium]